MMSTFKSAAAAAALFVAAGTAAEAATIAAGDIGATFIYDFAQTFNGNDLSATMEWELTDYSDGAGAGPALWTFQVDVTNTTAASEVGDNRLSIWGFNTTPESDVNTGVAPAPSWFFVEDANVPSGLGTYQVCAKDAGGTANCSGGGSGGLGEGQSQTFNFTISTALADPLVFSSIFVRYQEVGFGPNNSTAFTGTDRPDPEPNVIPLPATALLLLGGIGGLGAMRSLRRKS